jgi:hypothetical protein
MSYRQLKVQKRVKGKLRRYKNLATFNKECAKSTRARIHSGSVMCQLENVRKLRDGSGMATVRTVPLASGNDGKRGTWLLHFASHDVMKRHLKGRVSPTSVGNRPAPSLDGRKRRKRR